MHSRWTSRIVLVNAAQHAEAALEPGYGTCRVLRTTMKERNDRENGPC
jgi:hypothetical protein